MNPFLKILTFINLGVGFGLLLRSEFYLSTVHFSLVLLVILYSRLRKRLYSE